MEVEKGCRTLVLPLVKVAGRGVRNVGMVDYLCGDDARGGGEVCKEVQSIYNVRWSVPMSPRIGGEGSERRREKKRRSSQTGQVRIKRALPEIPVISAEHCCSYYILQLL